MGLREAAVNAASEAAVNAARRREEIKVAQFNGALTDVMSTPSGRLVFWRLCLENITSNPMVPGSSEGTAFNVGVNRMTQAIYDALMSACPELLAQTITEFAHELQEGNANTTKDDEED